MAGKVKVVVGRPIKVKVRKTKETPSDEEVRSRLVTVLIFATVVNSAIGGLIGFLTSDFNYLAISSGFLLARWSDVLRFYFRPARDNNEN